MESRVIPIRGVMSWAYLCIDGTLIDTGTKFDAAKILEVARTRNIDISRIILTHSDVDHVGGLPVLNTELNVPVYAIRRKGRQGVYGKLLSGRIPEPFNELDDNQHLPVLSGAIVVSARGHTHDSVAVYVPDESILFSGDALQVRRCKPCPPHYVLNQEPIAAVESYQRLMQLNARHLYPGHRRPLHL
ncbi:MAG: MBL fold metallo-hydrolase [Candidatus Woesearchaeota archaeon]